MLRKFFVLVFLFVLFLPTFSSLLKRGYFPMHDDMQAMRLYEMDKCFKDNQIPCRWVPDMGYGYGYPQFNYYSPLPYYGMEVFHLLGLGYLDSVKISFIVSVLLSAMGMYLLGSSLWGRTGGIISTIFYLFVPYRAVDMYVRGAVGEFWALAFLPFILWSIKGIFKGNNQAVMWTAFSIAALFTSHNITVIIFMPVILLWVVFLIFEGDDSPLLLLSRKIKPLFLSFIWGFCLSAFFLLPAWFEKNLVHIETLWQGYFNYLAHFVSIKQLLFTTFWGYGGSELGPYDNLSFSIGLFHWWLPLLLFVILIRLRRKKELKRLTFFILVGWLFLFMTHVRSSFIWSKIEILKYLQFPWRFLVIPALTFSVAVGSLGKLLNKQKSKLAGTVFIYLVAFFFYGSFFKPVEWLKIDDEIKFSGDLWEKQLTISIFDYLPIDVKAPPSEKAPDKPYFIEGEGKVVNGEKGTNWQKWEIEVEKAGKVRLPLFYFPNWTVWVDGKREIIDYRNDLALITFNVLEGRHQIYLKLKDTWIRKTGNFLSLLSLSAVLLVLKKKEFKG